MDYGFDAKIRKIFEMDYAVPPALSMIDSDLPNTSLRFVLGYVNHRRIRGFVYVGNILAGGQPE